GSKLSKTIYDGSSSTTINYIGGFEFDNSNALTSFAMPEGRVRKTGSSTFTFEYFITDHQGNVRVSFEDNSGSAIVRQENSYYPYGMIMAGNYQPSAPNNNLYNAGSRWQDDFSGIVDYFSTFFREYDPVLGRFNSVDPKAEVTFELSVYHYANNNPINFNDPLGDLAEGPSTYRDVNNNKWHGQNPHRTTAIDGMVYDHINGGLMEWFEGYGSWFTNGSGGSGSSDVTRILGQIGQLINNGYNIKDIIDETGKSWGGATWYFNNGSFVGASLYSLTINHQSGNSSLNETGYINRRKWTIKYFVNYEIKLWGDGAWESQISQKYELHVNYETESYPVIGDGKVLGDGLFIDPKTISVAGTGWHIQPLSFYNDGYKFSDKVSTKFSLTHGSLGSYLTIDHWGTITSPIIPMRARPKAAMVYYLANQWEVNIYSQNPEMSNPNNSFSQYLREVFLPKTF
ncbi:MAG: hypothetical protein E6H07_16875, partial [Bacteroidetes bacterium]